MTGKTVRSRAAEIPHQPAYKDWTGSADLLEDLVAGEQLENLFGLAREQWLVVGFTVEFGNHDRTEQVWAFAVNKHELGLGAGADAVAALVRYGEEHGFIPTYRILITGTTMAQIFAQMKCVRMQFSNVCLEHSAFSVMGARDAGSSTSRRRSSRG